MNNKDESIKLGVTIVELLLLLLGAFGYVVFYNHIYSTLNIKVDNSKSIEYGSKEYDLKDLIVSSNGNVKDIVDKVDTSIVGEQKVNVVVEKYNISKVIPISVNVVDNSAPVIELKEEEITITQGDSYDVLDNISFVTDDVDGDLKYEMKEIVDETIDINYYTIKTDFDNSSAGDYEVEVKAVDRSNNISTKTFSIHVEAPQVMFKAVSYAPAGVNSNGNSIVNTAYSLLGSPYVSGGTSPSGFDCSGFVQYVYAQNGLYISRSSSTQVDDGVKVNYSDAQPGDILIWGYSNGVITHSALYVGDDLMIHAANPSTGVIQSSVSGWTRGSDVEVLYVIRVVS